MDGYVRMFVLRQVIGAICLKGSSIRAVMRERALYF